MHLSNAAKKKIQFDVLYGTSVMAVVWARFIRKFARLCFKRVWPVQKLVSRNPATTDDDCHAPAVPLLP
jgi:hypothetical protein